MYSLEDLVKQIIQEFMKTNQLFTALDVSNKAKITMPWARHKEVRDLVRDEFINMQSSGYDRTPIDVTIADGSTVTAMLYHHVSDSWDLDAMYDNQKRTTASVTTATPAIYDPSIYTYDADGVVTGLVDTKAVKNALKKLSPNDSKTDSGVSSSVTAPPTVSVVSSIPVAVSAPAVTVPSNTTVTIDPTKRWEDLFDGVKLFPTN